MGQLYLVPTPIGHLGDISRRTAETLSAVDFIACEDTRVTRKLLTHLDIHKPLVSYHAHNMRESGQVIADRLQSGESAALVTDAGMPAISDPGEELVALCAEQGIPVVALPGPCAVVTALAVSGLPTGRFCFEGFLTMNKRSRRQHLQELAAEPRTMVFYEAPHKLLSTLSDLHAVLGDRRVAVCRELTKLHEQVLRTTLSGAARYFAETPPRGEFVLVIEGAVPTPPEDNTERALQLARAYLASGDTLRDAVRKAAGETNVSKNALYQMLLQEEGK